MAADLRELIAARPLVPVLVQDAAPSMAVDAILQGLEEEGIPAVTETTGDPSITHAAKEIAQLARLNIGIGVSKRQAVLHHRDLHLEEPLFTETIHNGNVAVLRRLGANAARLVKGNPLLFANDEEATPPSSRVQKAAGLPLDPALADRIVQEILKQLAARR